MQHSDSTLGKHSPQSMFTKKPILTSYCWSWDMSWTHDTLGPIAQLYARHAHRHGHTFSQSWNCWLGCMYLFLWHLLAPQHIRPFPTCNLFGTDKAIKDVPHAVYRVMILSYRLLLNWTNVYVYCHILGGENWAWNQHCRYWCVVQNP